MIARIVALLLFALAPGLVTALVLFAFFGPALAFPVGVGLCALGLSICLDGSDR